MKLQRGLLVLALCFTSSFAVEGWMLEETRYCGAPSRDSSGVIKRSSAVTSAFQRLHPCPSTGLKKGACPGWAMNHVIPLACGGCDAVNNLDWMPNVIKSCSDKTCRDRFERQIYQAPYPIEDTKNCSFAVIKK